MNLALSAATNASSAAFCSAKAVFAGMDDITIRLARTVILNGMYKKSGNPQVEELTKSHKERSYNLSDFKPIITVEGIKNCIWCSERLYGNKRKWCSNKCVVSALTWSRPNSTYGLYELINRQNGKCAHCDLSYLSYIEQIMPKKIALNKEELSPKRIDSLMRKLKKLIPRNIRPEIDHVVPISLGGVSLGLENHQILCSQCHKVKTKNDTKERFTKNGNPRKGIKFTKDHVEALSESRKGFDSPNRMAHRETIYEENRIKIVAINFKTKQEFTFDSIADAAKFLNLQESNISRVLRGNQNRKQHKGWTFRLA